MLRSVCVKLVVPKGYKHYRNPNIRKFVERRCLIVVQASTRPTFIFVT